MFRLVSELWAAVLYHKIYFEYLSVGIYCKNFNNQCNYFFKAEESTKRWAAGKQFSDLDGVPIAIKDQIDIEGLTVRNGLPFPENNPSTFDGAVIEKVKKAWDHIII